MLPIPFIQKANLSFFYQQLLVNALLLIPTIFIQLPILINIVIHFVMAIVVPKFAAAIFNRGWPAEYMCERWEWDPNTQKGHLVRPSYQCKNALGIIQILMGVGGGIAIFIR